MKVNNPFLYITPRAKDLVVGRKEFLTNIEKTVLGSLDEPVIIAVNGEFGIGKTQFIERVVKDLAKRKTLKIYNLDFSLNTLNDLRSIPAEKELNKQIIIIIDRFELILSLTTEIQDKILDVMSQLCRAKVTLIVATSTSLIKKIGAMEPDMKKYFRVLNVPAMNYEETKQLVVSRLNESRADKSDSISPFTENELRKIHSQAKGNPRMVLMLCASLFEEKF